MILFAGAADTRASGAIDGQQPSELDSRLFDPAVSHAIRNLSVRRMARARTLARAVTSTLFGAAWIPSDNPTGAILLGEFIAVRAVANERARYERRGCRRAFFLVLVSFRLLLLAVTSQSSLCDFILALVGVSHMLVL